MSKSRKKIPQVLLIMETSIKACRDKLRGILKYIRLHSPWVIHLIEGRVGEQPLDAIRQWGGAGIITETFNRMFMDSNLESNIVKAKLPTVLLDPMEVCLKPDHPFSQFCSVRCDSRAIGRLAAEHLLECGCQHFAFIGEIYENNWSCFRRDAFAERLAESEFSCYVYGKLTEKEQNDWGTEQKRLIPWLRKLPKPVGMMAANDARARQIIEACQIAGIDIPNEVAIVGVDNDEMICEMTNPPLSSVMTDGESGGYRAAEMLDALMRGEYRKQRVDYYGPLYVARRHSTEAMMIDDRIVAEAIEFIRINITSPIGVGDVARQLEKSRRFLELRFKNALGRTVSEEILRGRMERVRNLLVGTDLRITEIAILCGFQNEYYLSTVFKRRFGITMSQFRNKNRPKHSG
jgi:LacI family transcriptional regulator